MVESTTTPVTAAATSWDASHFSRSCDANGWSSHRSMKCIGSLCVKGRDLSTHHLVVRLNQMYPRETAWNLWSWAVGGNRPLESHHSGPQLVSKAIRNNTESSISDHRTYLASSSLLISAVSQMVLMGGALITIAV